MIYQEQYSMTSTFVFEKKVFFTRPDEYIHAPIFGC